MQNVPPILENLVSVHSIARSWSGVNALLTDFTCSGRVMYEVPHQQNARVGMILEEVGEHRSEPRLKRSTACTVDYRPKQLNFVPAGMDIWGFSQDIRYARDIRVSFDAKELAEHCHIKVTEAASAPDLRFSDERLSTLMQLIAGAVSDQDAGDQLYGDGLITALAARFFSRSKVVARGPSRLSPLQLRNAISYLEASMPLRVELATLASHAGLSPYHFSRAFKASTGLAPYQWQLRSRIQHAQSLLLTTSASLESVAEATGFADAVHFGRTFRKLIGATPAAWRRDRRS